MQINPRRRGARLLLSSPQAMHSAVLHGFADPQPTDEGRILWRLDQHSPHRIFLFVSSPEKPDFTHVAEQAGWPTTEAWDTRAYDSLLDNLTPGRRWRFRLTANPVHTVKLRDWKDSKPVGHVTVAQQQQWLCDRAERNGFRLAPSAADQEELDYAVVDRAVKRFQRKGTTVTVATATYQGTLLVDDPVQLRRALTFGIGRAKSYGCGLLTLAREPGGETT